MSANDLTIDELIAEMDFAINTRDERTFTATTGIPKNAPLTADAIQRGLIESGARRTLARRLASDASADLSDWAHAAIQAGLAKTEIATLGRISRQALDTMLATRQPLIVATAESETDHDH